MVQHGIPALAERVVQHSRSSQQRVPAQGGVDGPLFFDDEDISGESFDSFTSDQDSSTDYYDEQVTTTDEDQRLFNIANVIRNSSFRNSSFINVSQNKAFV